MKGSFGLFKWGPCALSTTKLSGENVFIVKRWSFKVEHFSESWRIDEGKKDSSLNFLITVTLLLSNISVAVWQWQKGGKKQYEHIMKMLYNTMCNRILFVCCILKAFLNFSLAALVILSKIVKKCKNLCPVNTKRKNWCNVIVTVWQQRLLPWNVM